MSFTSSSTPNIQLDFTQFNNIDNRPNYLTFRLPKTFISEDDEVCLNELNIFYSWYNITANYQNNTFQYIWIDGSSNNVTIPDGNYDIGQINGYLQFVMTNNGHYLVDENGVNQYYISLQENQPLYKITLTCTALPSSLPE